MADGDRKMVNLVVAHSLAKHTTDSMRAYIERGRAYSSLSEADLRLNFIKNFRLWAADFPNTSLQQISEGLRCEYELRKIEPPYHEVSAEAEALIKLATTITEELSDERRAAIETGFVEDYLADIKNRQ